MAGMKTTKAASLGTTEQMIRGYLYVPARHDFTASYHERRCAAPSVEETWGNQELLAKALERLPPDQLRVLQLARVDGLSHEQIARDMNITPRRVRTLLARALKHCVDVCQSAGEST